MSVFDDLEARRTHSDQVDAVKLQTVLDDLRSALRALTPTVDDIVAADLIR